MEKTESNAGAASPKNFTQDLLPWVVTGAAFIFYLFTLNRWLTVPGLAAIPRIVGWDWEIIGASPVLYLVTGRGQHELP